MDLHLSLRAGGCGGAAAARRLRRATGGLLLLAEALERREALLLLGRGLRDGLDLLGGRLDGGGQLVGLLAHGRLGRRRRAGSATTTGLHGPSFAAGTRPSASSRRRASILAPAATGGSRGSCRARPVNGRSTSIRTRDTIVGNCGSSQEEEAPRLYAADGRPNLASAIVHEDRRASGSRMRALSEIPKRTSSHWSRPRSFSSPCPWRTRAKWRTGGRETRDGHSRGVRRGA